MDGVTATLARFLVNSQPGEVPDAVVHEAKRALLHWIGCSVGGSQQESVRCALATVDEFSGPRQASVLGRREKLDIMLAALVNGISSDVLSFTDTHAITLIHPGAVIGAPLLALAERKKITGRDFVHAFILGFEVSSRVSLSVFPWHYLRGWHITGTAGIFGATAAAGKILGLDEQHMIWALGIAATQSAGLRGSFGSMSKNLHIGRAAQNGLFSALLASKGYTSSNQGIEAKRGFAHVFGEAPNLAAITTKLGESWELPQNTYKAFPCGSVIHPVIEGCLKLKSSNQINAKDIQRITLRVHPLVLELTGRDSPTDTLEAKLSVYHSAAAAFIAGKMTLEEYSVRSVTNPEIIALRKKVTATADAAIRDDEAYVSIELINGKQLRHHVDHVIGSSGCPLTDKDIETKFRGLTEPLLPKASVGQLIDTCWSLTQINDAAVLARLASLE